MAMIRFQKSLLSLSIGLALTSPAQAALNGQNEAIARLSANTGFTAQVSISSATGAARFVRAAPGTALAAAPVVRSANTDAARQAYALQFLANYADLFGISNPATELVTSRIESDNLGSTHLTHQQVYQGVPVFGALLKSHFDAAGNLTVVNGTFVPGIDVSTTPLRTAAQAASTALARVRSELTLKPAVAPTALAPTLVIYREGLTRGIEGANHLAWRVEVTNRGNVRDFVFVDAISGKVIDKIRGIHDAKNRRAFDSVGGDSPGPNYPNNPFWFEGRPFPTGTAEADNMIAASAEVYDLFKTAFGRDSYDANGARMDSIFNVGGDFCPNAFWNGIFVAFCTGTTADDVTAHEWGHAYTEYTHNLIYAWQSGALNEAYSDIWGETVDRLNGRGGDTPDTARSAGSCTVSTTVTRLNVVAPAVIAGTKDAGGAQFGPQTYATGVNDVVLVNDAAGASPSDACETPFANAAAVAGKIALADRGNCTFIVKAKNAQLNGAIGLVIANNTSGLIGNMIGSDPTVTIPSLIIQQADGAAVKAQSGVRAALLRGPGTDNSVRWLVGEDGSAFGGALRDMYNPSCYANPGKVSDVYYSCATSDSGGVHTNSGVPNHGYALLVDGGSYNGQAVNSIGLTKAAHLYYRAEAVYQGPASNFADHADSLAQSCADLTGINLASLVTGAPSGQILTAADCGEVAKAALAVELRTPPAQCNFQPLLAQSPPPLCAAGTNVNVLAADGFDGGKRGGLKWLVGSTAATGDFKPADWGVVNSLPKGRPGYGIFVPDANVGTCAPGSDASSSQRLDSPEITLPPGTTAPRLSFDHYVATETDFDGGNLKISVNGGPWTLVAAGDFIYNGYNSTLVAAGDGNSNPIAGQPAFTGSDGGTSVGTWGRSIVNLAPYAAAGDKIKLRFEFGKDACVGNSGWYLDDVTVYRCTP